MSVCVDGGGAEEERSSRVVGPGAGRSPSNSHDRWPEWGREDPLHWAVPERTSRCHRAYLTPSDGFSFPRIRSVTQRGGTEVPGGEWSLAPCAAKGGTRVGPLAGPGGAHLPRKGRRALQQRFPLCGVWETCTTECEMQGMWLGCSHSSWTWFAMCAFIFISRLGADLVLLSFPELRDFLMGVCRGDLHVCVWSASVRQ